MDFLKSFFVPSKMRRFRNMSIFIAITIFLVSTYLFAIPIKYKFSKPNEVMKLNAYLSKDFNEAESNFDYSEIKANNYVINAKESKLSADSEELKVFKVESLVSNNNYNFYFVFDFSKESFESSEDLYAKYEIEKEKSSCIVLFAPGFYELQNLVVDTEDETKLNVNTIQAASYKDCEIDFNSYNDTNEFLDGVGLALAKLYGSLYVTSFTLTSALMIFLLPMGVILLMWLILRKNGSLKRFKEYYNIASIVSILPTLIAFGISWFWPQVVNFYITAFMMYYLIIIFRINALPNEEDKNINNINNY